MALDDADREFLLGCEILIWYNPQAKIEQSVADKVRRWLVGRARNA